jgi:hypothetical protein
MELERPKCPECDAPPYGTIDMLYAVSILVEDDDGEGFSHLGESKVDWDSQTTVEEDGKKLFICPNDHQWFSAVKGET